MPIQLKKMLPGFQRDVTAVTNICDDLAFLAKFEGFGKKNCWRSVCCAVCVLWGIQNLCFLASNSLCVRNDAKWQQSYYRALTLSSAQPTEILSQPVVYPTSTVQLCVLLDLSCIHIPDLYSCLNGPTFYAVIHWVQTMNTQSQPHPKGSLPSPNFLTCTVYNKF